jgi:hypothetical protein
LTKYDKEFEMTTLTQSNNKLLRNALRANAVFSGISGVLAMLDANLLVDFMGTGTSFIYIALGVNLVIYALLLFYYAAQSTVDMRFAWFAVIADALWVAGSAIILMTNMLDISVGGKWLVLILADVVLMFAIAQYIGIRRMR